MWITIAVPWVLLCAYVLRRRLASSLGTEDGRIIDWIYTNLFACALLAVLELVDVHFSFHRTVVSWLIWFQILNASFVGSLLAVASRRTVRVGWGVQVLVLAVSFSISWLLMATTDRPNNVPRWVYAVDSRVLGFLMRTLDLAGIVLFVGSAMQAV